MRQPIATALEWTADGQPFSCQFNDIYFSRENGLAETYHVFIKHNRLEERFTAMEENTHFTIAETGFGTGLNFLAAWNCFDRHARKGARLHYISTEKFPLCLTDIAKALSLWPELANYAKVFIRQYPQVHTPGYHHLSFDDGRILLTLIFDDALKAFSSLNGFADAWFLDGFSPKNNPDLWTQPLFDTIRAHSNKDTTYATFTAASTVKQKLAQSGFTVNKVKGFGKKRHMLCGLYQPDLAKEEIQTHITSGKRSNIWLTRHQEQTVKKTTIDRHAVVIGAGLAGCSTAYSMAKRGWRVTIIDQATHIASGASGNFQGALYLRLSGTETVLSTLLIQGYMYSLFLLRTLLHNEKNTSWSIPGLIQSCFDAREAKRQSKILSQGFPDTFIRGISKSELSELAGGISEQPGLLFSQGGWVHPPALCRALVAHAKVIFKGQHTAVSLNTTGEGWQIKCKEGHLLSAPVVVLANSHAATNLLPTHALPLRKIRGQISYLPETANSAQLNTVFCGKNYIMPAVNGVHTIGATHQFNDTDIAVRTSDHAENLQNLKTQFPWMYQALSCDKLILSELSGRTEFRCSSPDYLPIAGPVADASEFKKQFAILSKNAKARFEQMPVYLPGLYINTAHGSRGLITCPLSGELIAGYINNEMLPVPTAVMEGLHPNRFLARNLIRPHR